MKNKFSLLILLFVSLFVFAACGKNGEERAGGKLKSLTLTLNTAILSEISVEDFEFTVTGNDGVDYTGTAEFYVDGAKITGSGYSPAGNQGDHSVYAIVGAVKSNTCNFTVTAIAELTALTVTVDKEALLLTSIDSFNFTAMGDDGVDYTAEAEFYVDDMKIVGASYEAAGNEGTHTVYAKIGEIESPETTFAVVSGLESLAVAVDKPSLPSTTVRSFNFTTTGNNGVDYTEEADFYVDGAKIASAYYIASGNAGTHTVYAKIGDIESSHETFTVTASPEPTAFVHKVLIEDFTGTWCVWCTRVLNGIDELHKLTDKVVVAAIHCNPGSADFMALPESTAWLAPFGVTGLPTARINRSESWRAIPAYSYRDMDLSHPMDMVQESCNYGIAIASTMGASGGTIDVSYYFGTAVASAKCMIYVLEDGLVHDQDNAYTGAGGLYGGVSVIRNFVHNDVVRASVTNILGDNIPASNSAAKATFNKRFSAVYSSSNVDNLKVMAMLLDSGGRVLNVQVAPANEVKEFETK